MPTLTSFILSFSGAYHGPGTALKVLQPSSHVILTTALV